MSGAASARWVDETMADVITERATRFIEENRDHPFFLFFSTHDIHVPRVPHERFVGKTSLGPRGDVIVELDWSVGKILETLDRLKLTENTLVIFSSDNGPVVDDGYRDQAVERLGGHKPAGPWRGGKYSAFEGGTRVPFLVRWPAKVKPGTNDALICQVDFLASVSRLVTRELKASEAPDSVDVLSAMLGDTSKGREFLIEHAAGLLSVRHGNWKYISPANGPKIQANTNTETGRDPNGQLFDLAKDPGEQNNLVASQPERAKELAAYLDKTRNTTESRR
jgi:arylsulfatase A-like enzyme